MGLDVAQPSWRGPVYCAGEETASVIAVRTGTLDTTAASNSAGGPTGTALDEGRAMKRILWVAALSLLVVVGGCSGGGGGETAEDSAAAPADAVLEQETGGPASAGDAEGVGGAAAPQGSGAGLDESAAAEGPVDPAAPLPPASSGPERIIKEGTVRLEVDDDRFDEAYAAVLGLAPRYGGDVLASSTSTEPGEDGDGPASGSVTLRVPVEEYESLLAGVQEVGTVRSRDIRSEDVSAEFVDLESRQRNLEAQERFYLGLLERAEAVPDAIAVQQQLGTVTEQLEQIQGRLQFLEARTDFSTLVVELFEPAAAPLLTSDEPDGRPSLGRYWRTAQDAFLNVVGGTLVVLSFLAPLVLPLAAVVVLVRALRRQSRPVGGPPAAPPARADDRQESQRV